MLRCGGLVYCLVAQSVYSVGNKHIGRLNMCKGWVLVKVRIVGYLRVGSVAFGLCGGGRAVFHDVEFPCAEWWLAYLCRGLGVLICVCVVASPSWFRVVLCSLLFRRLKRLCAVCCLMTYVCLDVPLGFLCCGVAIFILVST